VNHCYRRTIVWVLNGVRIGMNRTADTPDETSKGQLDLHCMKTSVDGTSMLSEMYD
jgi:hypothetical protein